MYEILNNIKFVGAKFILESCKPYDILTANFSTSGVAGIEKKNKFFDYLKNLYETKKAKTVEEIKDCAECVVEINNKAGLNATVESLKNALTKDSYDKFLYSIFFDDCKTKRFPDTYQVLAYPADHMNVTQADLKEKIIEVVKSGKPVLYPNLCFKFAANYSCEMGHSFLISGFKKVSQAGKKDQFKDVFKVHNSWGEEWQKTNNDGWVDADNIINRVYTKEVDKFGSVASASAVWLGP